MMPHRKRPRPYNYFLIKEGNATKEVSLPIKERGENY
jgi:hypothetical protein